MLDALVEGLGRRLASRTTRRTLLGRAAQVGVLVAGGLRLGLLGRCLGGCHYSASSFVSASASSASAFLLLFLAALAGTSTGAGVARMPSSRSRMTV